MNIPAILDNIISLVKPKGDSVLGIDIGSSSIKVVQVREKSERAVLETYGEIALGPYGGTDIGRAVKLLRAQKMEALNDVMKESGSTTKTCGMAIPLSSSLITTMKVPKISESNLEEIVTMEARRYIPVSMEEITLDWQIIPDVNGEVPKEIKEGATNSQPEHKEEVKSANILIVAVHTEVIKELKELSEEASLHSRFFELEAFSNMRAIIPGDRRAVAMVDLGASSTKVYIAEGGAIKVSHTVPFGSQDITLSISHGTGMSVAEAEKRKRNMNNEEELKNLKEIVTINSSFVANEVLKFIGGYEQKNQVSIEEVIFSGGGISLKPFHDLLKEKIPIKSRVADPFSNLLAPAFLAPVLKETGPSFSVAIGLALRAISEKE